MAFTVYQHINKIDGKRYVGITAVEPKRRWRPDGSGYKSCPRFWRAIQEIGWDNFEHEIVAEELTEAEASEMEIALIKQYKSDHNKHGYNIAPGGMYRAVTPELRQRFSEQRKGTMLGKDNPNYGNHKLAGKNNPNYGKKHSAETRALMSQNRKGKGLHEFSDEHKRKLKENHAGGAEPKRVLCVETGIIYSSINDAARAIGGTKNAISAICRKVPHYNTCKGYHLQFYEE